ncbi:MAG: TonB-dependent receptor [Pseudomonas sp.]
MKLKLPSAVARHADVNLRIALLAALLAPPLARADTSSTADQTSTLDTLVVTGSRAGGRTVKNSSTPIDVISAQDLAATGQANLLEALQYTLPSLSSNPGGASGEEQLIRSYQLRNLAPGYTLVLVNGKRRNVSAYASGVGGAFPAQAWTDLGLIPVAAIDHIEVLRDGASAIYGSDAIAGVINVILKSQAQGGSASIESGQSYAGDGSRTTERANLGLPWGEDGFVNISVENTAQHHAIRRNRYRDSVNTGGAGGTADASLSSPSYRLKSAVLNAGHGIGENAQFYATLTTADRTAEAIKIYRLPSTIASYNSGALSVWPTGFQPIVQTKEQEYTGTAGVKGSLAGWDYDLSATWNRSTVRTYTNDSVNYSLTYPGSPTDFYDGKVDYRQAIANLDLRRGFEIAHLASPLEVSAGVEYQHEQYRRSPGQWESYYGYGAVTVVGFSPDNAVDASRDSAAAYVGASTSLSSRWYLDAALRYEDHSDFGGVSTGRLSTRFDFNDVFGLRATVSNGFHAPSLAAQYYQATNSYPGGIQLFAAQVGSAVARALGASDLQPEKARNYSIGLTFDPSRDFHLALDLYQIDLRNQIGLSSYIGYDASDSDAITDYSGTVLTSAQKATIDALLAQAGISIADGEAYYASYFTNVGDTRTRGLELTLEATQDTRWGKLRWNYALNYGKTDVTRVAAIPTVLQSLPNIELLSESTEYNLRYGTPKYTQVGGVNWSRGRWSVNLNLQHYGPIKRLRNGYYYQIDPKLLTNLGGSYDFGHGWSVDLGIDNLFNEKTSKVPYAAWSSSERALYKVVYDGTYDRVSTLGGYWYGRINYRF